MIIVKYLFYFILFFTLFYLESFQITSYLTFSQLWKIPLVLFMVWYVLIQKVNSRPKFNKIAYYFGIKNLFNQAVFTNSVTNIIETFRFTNFPLLYDSFNIYFKNPRKLERFILFISQYFILASIPFLLGIIESVNIGKEIGEDISFIGIFQNAHIASIVTTLAILVLVNHLKTNRLIFRWKLYNILLIILGLYCLYLTFVRTGYLMFAVGFIVIYMPSKFTIRQLILFLILALALSTSFYLTMVRNDSFRQRILDKNQEGEQMDIGSGRLNFAAYSLEFWADGNFQQLLLGRGLDNVKNNLEEKTGMRIFSHNGFVDALAINGIIGIFLFLLFTYYTFTNIRQNKETKSYRLALSIFFCYISFNLTQGGAAFPIDLFIGSILNLINKERSASINERLHIYKLTKLNESNINEIPTKLIKLIPQNK